MISVRPLVFAFLGVAVFASYGLLCSTAAGQQINGQDIPASVFQRNLSSVASLPTERAPLEGPIDPDLYDVGPGDGFQVTIGGQIPLSQMFWVSADGTLVIPDVGSFNVAERSLRSARNEVKTALRRYFRNVDSDIVLAEPRQFYVHVSGAVLIPGRHVMTPIARVDDALIAAMGGVPLQQLAGLSLSRQALAARAETISDLRTLEPASLTPTKPLIPESDYIPAFRNVRVTHRDGTVDIIDILLYYATGSPNANPYLQDGDAITIQFFNPDDGSVGVAGAVAEPGVYDYRQDDTPLSLLLITLGPAAAEQVEEVRLLRTYDGTPEARTLLRSQLATTPLMPGDRLFVLPRNERAGMADITGATYFPSSYPIEVGETTLRDFVAMAGGFLPDALVRGAYLERDVTKLDAEAQFGNRELALEPTLRLDIRENALAAAAFDLTRLSTLSYIDKQYLAREFLDRQRVSINFEEALRDGAPPVYLEDGDNIVVPFDLRSVFVFGQVPRPGHIPYEPGLSVDDYVALAGGRSAGATETYVMSAMGSVIPAEEAGPLHSGDLVFVNRGLVAEDRLTQQAVNQDRSMSIQDRGMTLAESRAQSDSTFRIISTVLAAISTAVTVFLLFRN